MASRRALILQYLGTAFGGSLVALLLLMPIPKAFECFGYAAIRSRYFVHFPLDPGSAHMAF